MQWREDQSCGQQETVDTVPHRPPAQSADKKHNHLIIRLAHSMMLAVWHNGDVTGCINKVTLRQAWLVPGWVNVTIEYSAYNFVFVHLVLFSRYSELFVKICQLYSTQGFPLSRLQKLLDFQGPPTTFLRTIV